MLGFVMKDFALENKYDDGDGEFGSQDQDVVTGRCNMSGILYGMEGILQ